MNWFKENEMIVNPDKFQAIVMNKHGKMNNSYKINIGSTQIKSKTSVDLLGINIVNMLNFDDHIASLCKKAAGQLNVLSRLNKFLGQKEKECIINSFVYAYFNYCPLVWHFCSAKSITKVEKYKKEH